MANKSIVNCKIKANLAPSNAEIQRVLGNIGMGMHGTLQLGVYSDYVTRYLALEYGVAGYAISEKREFGSVASQVVIPRRGLNADAIVYWSDKSGQWTKHLRTAASLALRPIMYKGVRPIPRGIVRALMPEFRRMLQAIPHRVLRARFKGKWTARKRGTSIQADEKIKELYKQAMIEFGEQMLEMVRSRTPYDKARIALPGIRTQQLINAGRNIGHLADDGYFIKFIERN